MPSHPLAQETVTEVIGMKHGYWIPISKAFKVDFPKDRAFSTIEAVYSLQLDYDKKKKVTITGYSKLWRWSKGKVIRFLESMNAGIKYAEDTKRKQNQNSIKLISVV